MPKLMDDYYGVGQKRRKRYSSAQRKAMEARWAREARAQERYERLCVLHTPAEIINFASRLVAVTCSPLDECWFYIGLGKGLAVPWSLEAQEGPGLKSRYANHPIRGENVGPHRLAMAISLGIPVAELVGDVHHSSSIGVCWGLICANPDHLELVDHREHARLTDEEAAALSARVNERHIKMVRLILDSPPVDRQPKELQGITGAARARRYIGGLPFLIKVGHFEEFPESQETAVDYGECSGEECKNVL